MNPYYVAFAGTESVTCEEKRRREYERWPGGAACGFILWMSDRWQEWAKFKGYRRTASGSNDTMLSDYDHAEFGGWLRGSVFAAREMEGCR